MAIVNRQFGIHDRQLPIQLTNRYSAIVDPNRQSAAGNLR